jgi:pilus assembly protein Flp/PilA
LLTDIGNEGAKSLIDLRKDNRFRKEARDMFYRVCDWLSRRDEKGATAVEYGIMVALIAAVIIAVVTLLGQQLVVVFQKVATALGLI